MIWMRRKDQILAHAFAEYHIPRVESKCGETFNHNDLREELDDKTLRHLACERKA